MTQNDFRKVKARLGLYLILPAVFLVILVVILPIISGIQISFTSQRGVWGASLSGGVEELFRPFWDKNFIASLGRSAFGSLQMDYSKLHLASNRIADKSALQGTEFCANLDLTSLGSTCSSDCYSLALDV
ncbi:MAG: hypothetical protein Ct9H300mP28_14310 [Pseudomonadota bacterium]|nr:MAG: hypothetical protein Ct9H300mP28_14310 [Pseudomonadota bacterium]